MATKEVLQYYADTFNREVRDDLAFAVTKVENEKIAIDCGCGSGSDIEYLRKLDFRVYAFDIEEESIKICKKRFNNDISVQLSKASFSSYIYPKSSLLIADASLFFCSKFEFNTVWEKICESLIVGGIFCGSFLGPNDSMASPKFNRKAYWPNIFTLERHEVETILSSYEVLKFTEHKYKGKTPDGNVHNWHIYSVVAKKT